MGVAVSQAASVVSQRGGFVGFRSGPDHLSVCSTMSCVLPSVIGRHAKRVELGSLAHRSTRMNALDPHHARQEHEIRNRLLTTRSERAAIRH